MKCSTVSWTSVLPYLRRGKNSEERREKGTENAAGGLFECKEMRPQRSCPVREGSGSSQEFKNHMSTHSEEEEKKERMPTVRTLSIGGISRAVPGRLAGGQRARGWRTG
jgi:hypothetical protein